MKGRVVHYHGYVGYILRLVILQPLLHMQPNFCHECMWDPAGFVSVKGNFQGQRPCEVKLVYMQRISCLITSQKLLYGKQTWV